jgi:exosortase/archaeosortase family protein
MAPKRRRRVARPAPPAKPAPTRSAAVTRRPATVVRRFLLRFLGLAAGFFTLYQLTEVTHLFGRVNELNALLSGWVLRLAGVPNTRAGSSLQLPTSAFAVISECSAVYVAILYAAAVLAFPASWRARGRGLVTGLAIIFVVNVLRLVTLGELMHRRPAWLPLFHEYLWQVLFILIVAAIYVAWIERIVPRVRTGPTA